ncbi:fimbria/pilus outer membrane usher protein [Xenorhabdus bovienii]|uniref:fimbria/pilus outer membrane usher protein n=1 Tax=Xenorhabdus bovienii TaxID=40576 RepID=UPI0023B24E3C|nr:fimbria/pilus outer membrane usher protein [Xenorhabdus bovienii]MDE9460288.1 fimbria/pilus outer membrane usher protein [Xenorhabdus bovienii]MDE9468536.1 fimbria/pilus outer membrane usher protein [Xenorhabdus bovienii]
MNKTKRRQIKYLLAFSVLITLYIQESGAMEFNADMLDLEDKQNIDLSRFSQTGYVMPGQYQLALRVNEQDISHETTIPFYSRKAGDKTVSEICISPKLRDRIGLTEKALNNTGLWHQGQCVDFSPLKGVKLSAEMSESQLNMTIPQLYLEYSDPFWSPPSLWDNGIPGLLLDYNLSANATKPTDDAQSQNAWLNGTLGANYGAWRLRADYQGNYYHTTGGKGQKESSLDLSRVYLYRALPSWRSNLILGESSFNSALFSGWSYTGLGMESDERQLPSKLRGYAPQINGIADTNARVTVTQQGRVLYETTVPPGPFSIQDISSAVRGTLDVKITEQDGKVKTFQVNAAYVPYLTRPGQFRYKFVSGRSRYNFHKMEGPLFGAGEISYGISNRWSLYGGGVAAGNYNAMALGAGLDLMQFGTLSADVTQSVSKFSDNQRTQKGKSWRLSYSKRFDDVNTDVNFAGYRFSERDYMTMQQYLDARYRDLWGGRSKEMYTISLNKSFPEQQMSLGLSYNYQTYWDQGNITYYSARADKYFSAFGLDNLSLGISTVRSRYANTGKMNDEILVNLNVPLTQGSMSYNGAYSGGRFSHSTGYYGRAGDNDHYSLTAGMNHGGGEHARAQISGYYSHLGDIAQTSANMSMVQGRYISMGLSASGGATVTAKGAALHSGGFNGGTRLMVDTSGVANVPIDSGRVTTNHWGIGVVTDVSSYYRNTTMVDVNKLSENMEARNAVVESILTDGAIGYRKFEVLKGIRLFAVLRLEDNSMPPFGASVRNVAGRELGIVSDDGIAWVSGAQPNETLQVDWNNQQCTAKLPNHIDPVSQLVLPCQRKGMAQEPQTGKEQDQGQLETANLQMTRP